jgi:hypothetical protein
MRKESLRSQFRLSINDDGSVHVSNIEPLDFKERELLNHIVSELQIEFQPSKSELQEVRPFSMSRVEESFDRIAYATPRQEERIALLLSEILGNRDNGMYLLRNYKPRAEFERRALERIKEDFNEGLPGLDYKHYMFRVVDYLYALIFPLNRGYLLEYLSKHLGMYPEINRAIGQKLAKTNSRIILRHANEITANLTKYS